MISEKTDPYTPEQRRVANYLHGIAPDIGAGDDPIGFLISSHATLWTYKAAHKSYHNLFITTKDIPHASIFNLGYGLMVSCTRMGGWELWGQAPSDGGERTLLAGEYAGAGKGLLLDVDGYVIVDSLTRDGEEDDESSD